MSESTSRWIDRVWMKPMGPGFVVGIGLRTMERFDRRVSAELFMQRLGAEFRRRNGDAA